MLDLASNTIQTEGTRYIANSLLTNKVG